jgi:hypothetical protein
MADTFTFTQAAEAAELRSRQLRNLLDNPEYPVNWLDAQDTHRPGGWRRFTLADIFRLRFVGIFVWHGWSVDAAVAHAEALVDLKGNGLPSLEAAQDAFGGVKIPYSPYREPIDETAAESLPVHLVLNLGQVTEGIAARLKGFQ